MAQGDYALPHLTLHNLSDSVTFTVTKAPSEIFFDNGDPRDEVGRQNRVFASTSPQVIAGFVGDADHATTPLTISNLASGVEYHFAAFPFDAAKNYGLGAYALAKTGGASSPVGTFEIALKTGLNMVSLPVRPDTPLTAQTFIDKLGATVLTKLDVDRQRFIPYLPGISKDFPIEGGAGYIVNVTKDTSATFTGTVWNNVNPAPSADTQTLPLQSPVWAFVIGGEVHLDGLELTVRNRRTGQVTVCQIEESRYTAVFADLSQRSVVEVGDVLEIAVAGIDGVVHYTVTAEDLRRAFTRLTLSRQAFVPDNSRLLQNYPNPFNPETWIPYQLAANANVEISIYDSRGALVRRLVLGHQSAGYYHARHRAAHWDGRTATGEIVSSGLYFYRLRAGNFTATRRMLIVK